MGQSLDQDQLDQDQIEDRLCLTLQQASRAMTAAYRKVLDPLHLTYPQYTVLSVLWRTDAVTVKDLGDVLGSGHNTMSPLIKRLETKALVTRSRNEADEREVLVQLTTQGKQLCNRAASVQADIRRATGLTGTKHQALVNALHQLANELETFAG